VLSVGNGDLAEEGRKVWRPEREIGGFGFGLLEGNETNIYRGASPNFKTENRGRQSPAFFREQRHVRSRDQHLTTRGFPLKFSTVPSSKSMQNLRPLVLFPRLI
jgi:hypothetical protein